MKIDSLLAVVCFMLVLSSNSASAGGAPTAAVGPNSPAASAANASGDGSGVLKKWNQHSVKSYTLMRQLLSASGVKGAGISDNK